MEEDKWILSLKPVENENLIPKDMKYELKKNTMTINDIYNLFVKVVYVWDLVYTHHLDLLFINLVNKKHIKLDQTTKNVQYMIALIMRAKHINLDVILIELDDTLILVDYETSIKQYEKNIPLLNYFNWTLKCDEIFSVSRLRLIYNGLIYRL